MLCKYKDIFGKVVHSYRIFYIKIVDVSRFIDKNFIFISNGIIYHRLFCVRTTIDKLSANYRHCN
jgi:hypothetical protein